MCWHERNGRANQSILRAQHDERQRLHQYNPLVKASRIAGHFKCSKLARQSQEPKTKEFNSACVADANWMANQYDLIIFESHDYHFATLFSLSVVGNQLCPLVLFVSIAFHHFPRMVQVPNDNFPLLVPSDEQQSKLRALAWHCSKRSWTQK